MTRRLSLSLAMLAAGVALLLAAGLALAVGGAGEARKGGTLRLASFQDPDSIDTALAWTPWSLPIVYATCAKLFNLPDASGDEGAKVVPEVVRAPWSVSRDRRTYTFDLKRTFRFHTGARVTAQSFADAFNRDAQPKLHSPAVDFMREIEGAAAVIDGTAESISGIRVLGRYRLQIRLTRPVGDFTARLTLGFFCPILPTTPTDSEIVTDPPGSGPYYVDDRVVNKQIVLKRNRYYRGDRPAYVDEVVWKTDMSREACLAAVQQDLVDHCVHFSIPFDAYRPLAEQYGINKGQLFVTRGLTTWFLVFNHDRPAFQGRGQIPLKKAINFAIDRRALAQPFGYLSGGRTDQLLPPALGARAESIYPLGGPNLTAAKRWFARARIRPTKLVLYVSNAPTQVTFAQLVTFELRQLGIDVEVKYFDIVALLERVSTRGEPFDINLNGWAADYADGGSFLEPILNGKDLGPTGNANLSYFDDPATNAKIEAATRLTGEARRKAWADLDVDVMRDNPPVAPIIHTNNRAFVSKSLGCFLFHPLYGFDIAAVCKK